MASLSVAKALTLETFEFEGFDADIVHYHASQDARLVLLFIPGNPGLLDYYHTFLESLHTSLPDAAIVGISQLGHTLRSPPNTRIATLDEQIRAKVDFADALQQEYPFSKCVLVGHSVGSYIILQMLKSSLQNIHSCHLLFPTISHIAKSPNGIKLQYLFKPWIASVAASCCGFLASCSTFNLRRNIVNVFTGQAAGASSVTTRFISQPLLVQAALGMACEEMSSIVELDSANVSKHANKLRFYLAKQSVDNWVRDEDIDELIKVLGEEGNWKRCEESLPHDFCCSEEHSRHMAHQCIAWIMASDDLMIHSL